MLIKDIQRECYGGIGKPEPLKNNLSGWWSRRIDDVNRIVYKEKETSLNNRNLIQSIFYGR